MTAVLHLTNNELGKRYAIEQGAVWKKITLLYDQNLTGWIPRGDIRTDYKDRGGELMASFAFDAIEYKSVTIYGQALMKSVVSPSLSSNTTENLGLKWIERKMDQRSNNNDAAIVGRNAWVYDIEAIGGGNQVLRIIQGLVEVDLRVTI